MIQVLSGPTQIMDGSTYRSFVLELAQNTIAYAQNLVPGRTYTVEARQVNGQPNTLTFVQNIRNAPQPQQGNGALTTMTFICLDDSIGYLSRSATYA